MTTYEGSALSPLTAEIARLVASSPGKRVLGEELLRGVSRFEPGLVGNPDARRRFRESIDELQAAGKITLPSPPIAHRLGHTGHASASGVGHARGAPRVASPAASSASLAQRTGTRRPDR